MNDREMAEAAAPRPSNYADLSLREQWEIDKQLGILDWQGPTSIQERRKFFNSCHATHIDRSVAEEAWAVIVRRGGQ